MKGEKRLLCAWEPRVGEGVSVRAAHSALEAQKWLTRAEGHPSSRPQTRRRDGVAPRYIRVASNLSQFRSWWTLAAEVRFDTFEDHPGHAADVRWRRHRARQSAARWTSRRGGGALRSLRCPGSLDAPFDPGS